MNYNHLYCITVSLLLKKIYKLTFPKDSLYFSDVTGIPSVIFNLSAARFLDVLRHFPSIPREMALTLKVFIFCIPLFIFVVSFRINIVQFLLIMENYNRFHKIGIMFSMHLYLA